MSKTETLKSKFKVGDRVLVSPQVTDEKNWIEATITEIEMNPFVGIVITVKSDSNVHFFEKEDMFKFKETKCTQ